MLVPIGHENMSARRWPVITIGLMFVNLLTFASTHRAVDQQHSQLWKVEKHILILAATHPDLVLTTEARKLFSRGSSTCESMAVPGVTTRVTSRLTSFLATRGSSIWSQIATRKPRRMSLAM